MLQSMQGVGRAGKGLRLLVICGACALLAPAAGAAPAGNGKVAFVDAAGIVGLVEPDGTGRTHTGLTGVVAVAWSPDGTRLAYTTGFGAERVPFVANADGSSPQRLVDDPSRPSYEIACWLAADTIVLNSTDALWVVDAGGSDLRRLTTEPGPYGTTEQACAADGSKVAYSVGAVPAAFWLPAAGGSPVRISTGDLLAGSPSLSPDGRYALVFRWEPGGSTEIQRVDLATGSVVALGQALGITFGFWSPDSTRIANQSFAILGSRFPMTASYIYVRAADGSSADNLSALPARPYPQDNAPAWSPDGTRILFKVAGSPALMVMNADGSCRTSLVPSGGPASWQPVFGGPTAPPIQCADIRLAPIYDRDVLATGEQATLRVAVENAGTMAATGVALDASAVPGDLQLESLESDQGSCSVAARRCELAPVPAGGAAVVRIGLRSTFDEPPLGNVLRSYAVSASLSETDPEPVDNTASWALRLFACTGAGSFVVGTPGDDVLCAFQNSQMWGRGGNDRLFGGSGWDRLDGGPGRDEIDGGVARDVVLSWDGRRDDVDCGPGKRDIALADRHDRLRGCEVASRTAVRCTAFGSWTNDRLTGTRRRDVLCGLSGNDELGGREGADRLEGGGGNDVLTGGPGRDELFGAASDDRIVARDGRPDRISCGTGRDQVLADRVDRVAQDCEAVLGTGRRP